MFCPCIRRGGCRSLPFSVTEEKSSSSLGDEELLKSEIVSGKECQSNRFLYLTNTGFRDSRIPCLNKF